MEILVIRHGECTWPRLEEVERKGSLGDPELNQSGIAQIKKTGNKLANFNITRIYSSLARRASNSAEILNNLLCVETDFNPLLNPVKPPIGNSLFDLFSQVVARKIVWQQAWLDGWPGLEPPDEYQQRTSNFLHEVIQTHTNHETIVIVAHEETVWALISKINNIPFQKAVKTEATLASITNFII